MPRWRITLSSCPLQVETKFYLHRSTKDQGPSQCHCGREPSISHGRFCALGLYSVWWTGSNISSSERGVLAFKKCLCHILAAAPAVRVAFIAEVFWEGDDKIGSNLICPRDGRMGCALVDWLMPEYRKKQTHFMPSDSEPEMFSWMGFRYCFLFKHHPF